MATDIHVPVAGIQIGLQRPLVLAVLPVVAILLGVLLLRARERTAFGQRGRQLLFIVLY